MFENIHFHVRSLPEVQKIISGNFSGQNWPEEWGAKPVLPEQYRP